jgi:3-methyladenine DNA glycosylase AlkD
MRRFGLSVPVMRGELKRGYSFLDRPPEDLIHLWDHVWNGSEWYEVMYQALYFYQGKPVEPFELEVIMAWVDRCACWQHSDDLSKILARVVEREPHSMLPTLREWNRSPSLWKRRQSVVCLIEYARLRKRVLPFEELVSFVDPLLDDEEYYVQKGVGWTLREIYNVYPEQALAYIESNVVIIRPAAYSPATEKLPKATKARLHAERKAGRRRT